MFSDTSINLLASVVQRLDNSIQQITCYPFDKTYQLHYIYLMYRIMLHSLNNWGQENILNNTIVYM